MFPSPQRRKKRSRLRTRKYLFTDVEQGFVELFVDAPKDVKVKHKETTYASIFISLVNLWRFTCQQNRCKDRNYTEVAVKISHKSNRFILRRETDLFWTQYWWRWCECWRQTPRQRHCFWRQLLLPQAHRISAPHRPVTQQRWPFSKRLNPRKIIRVI